LDGAASRAPRGEGARAPRLRAPATVLDRRAVARAARGRERRPRRLPRSRDMTAERAARLAPDVFDLPVEQIRAGYYTDAYFNHARSALLADGRHPHVLVQVFQKEHALLGGIDEAAAILELCSHGWDALAA